MNAMFATGAASFAKKEIDWINDTIRAQLLDAVHFTPAYDSAIPVPNVVGFQYLSDISSSAKVGAPSGPLTGKAATAGVLNANSPVTLPLIAGGLASYLLIYQDTGSPSSSRLILLYDTASGLPVLPNGGDILVYIDTSYFKLVEI